MIRFVLLPDTMTGVTHFELRSIPEGFNAHPTVVKLFAERRKMIESGIDMAFAEAREFAFL